jgi:hypothetical protein
LTGFEVLFDPDASAEGARVLDLPAGTTVLAAAEALDEIFAREPATQRVVIAVAGVPLGVSTRGRLLDGDKGAPPIRVDECPECRQTRRHEPWCSAATPARRGPAGTAGAEPGGRRTPGDGAR